MMTNGHSLVFSQVVSPLCSSFLRLPRRGSLFQQQSNLLKSMSSADDKEYKFLTEPDDDLKCMICLEVARDPLQHEECGKLFCKTCLEKHGRYNPCPNCRKHRSQYYVDKRGKRSIDALEVTCSNAKRKCKWQGALGTLDAHVTTCEFSLLPCPNQCKDEENQTIYFMRKKIQDHLKNNCPNRDFKCPNCGEEGKYSTITREHDEVCAKKKVLCFNKDCPKVLPREKVNAHIADECLHTVMPCKYSIIGCRSEYKRCDLAKHEDDDKLHLRMVMDATLELKRENVTLKEGESFTFAVTDYQRRLKHTEAFESPSFYTKPRGYHIKAHVYVNGWGPATGSHISAYVEIAKGKYDSELQWPFYSKVTITLLNQRHDSMHHSMPVNFLSGNGLVGDICGHTMYVSHDYLCKPFGMKQHYLKDDTLYFRISVDTPNHKPWLTCTIPPHSQ